MLADEPVAEPSDPCSAELESMGFPNSPTSRWLLALIQTMRALAEWDDAGDPPIPESARSIEPQLGLTSSLHFPEEIWKGRIRSMRDYCARTGRPPVHWVAVWRPIEVRALTYLELLESREKNLRRASAQLHDASMSGQVLVAGRKGDSFGEVPRIAFYDSRARWRTDAAARIYENCTRFTGGLEAGGIDFEAVTFRTEELRVLAGSRARAPTRSRRFNRTDVACEVIKEIYPNGRPNLPLKVRNKAINDELVRLGAEPLGLRAISNALAKAFPRQSAACRTFPPIADRNN